MAKTTKYYTLFQVLKSAGAKGASPATCAKKMDFALSSVPPYIHALRHKFGAEIETVRDGRQVGAYVLKNISEVEASMSPTRKKRNSVAKAVTAPAAKTVQIVKKTKAPKVKAVSEDGPVAVEDMQIEEITDMEMADIRSQLGL